MAEKHHDGRPAVEDRVQLDNLSVEVLDGYQVLSSERAVAGPL
jgi:hypothetical protein